ncbi:uncharacterized protein EI90DRAFT_3015196 [Cantharellus anzutake]|uniref:uncharacterized protein n=1 Tax=Cantharellus anzutake TaxID=1750568 RepID=UPI001905B493|nr:uncharacterized protein EI90DRAFT_3015196 [Cantharellus anzutake]KAF8334168.1 hypothetical protein EI90DRAFT_3015196 [Cantharellus anzutake]
MQKLQGILKRSPKSSPKIITGNGQHSPLPAGSPGRVTEGSGNTSTQTPNSLGLALSGVPDDPVISSSKEENIANVLISSKAEHPLPEDPAANWYGSPKSPTASALPSLGFVSYPGISAEDSAKPPAPEQAVAVSRTRDMIRKALGKRSESRASNRSPKSSPKHQARSLSPEGTKGAALTVAHDILDISVDLVGFAPIPGLREAANSLLKIWSLVQAVESNKMACLHLAERCASILASVRAEVEGAGPDVQRTLEEPLTKLNVTYHEIEDLMQKQVERPFIKRYLKRDEVLGIIQDCHEKLTDNLGAFGLAVQIRILREIKAQQATGNEIQEPSSQPIASPPPAYSVAPTTAGSTLEQSHISIPSDPSAVLPQIASHHQARFIQDYHVDSADLTHIIREVLGSGSEARLIEVLQIQRPDIAEAVKTLQRALEVSLYRLKEEMRSSRSSHEHESKTTTTVEQLSLDDKGDMTVHREFIEEGIEALRNMGTDVGTIPPWTITRWEVDRHKVIGEGHFSKVFKGGWKGRTVAIKVVARITPAHLFVHEAEIWKSLKHPNVLELLGASSASSNPPWFFVSPYMENGNLVRFLQQHPNHGRALQFIHEIAVGMAYLHGNNVLHGDLKASNVLIDDNFRCVITDFGQSKLKSEAYRISGTSMPTTKVQGTLRWLAPEAMDAAAHLTFERDVYAFAICCVEILGDGALPWANLDNFLVRTLVLERDQRPEIPNSPDATERMQGLIRACWDHNPAVRPSFDAIVTRTSELLHDQNWSGQDITPQPGLLPLHDESRSPSLNPKSPSLAPQRGEGLEPASPWDDEDPHYDSPVSITSEDSFKSIHDTDPPAHQAETSPPTRMGTKESSVYSGPMEHSHLISRDDAPRDGYVSPVPCDENVAERKDERRYRLNLNHPYHESLKLPLWTPSQVYIGDVGYHKRPHGSFVRLFSAFDPDGTFVTHGQHPPALKPVPTGTLVHDKRNILQRGLQWFGSILRPTTGQTDTPRTIARQYSFLLRAEHHRSMIVAESTTYRYMHSIESSKRWFAEHQETILKLYGRKHHLQKEDLLMVIGTLDTRDYALYGHAHFNVYSERWEGEPFGEWTTDTMTTPGGPHYDEDTLSNVHSANKVSKVRSNP